VDVSKQVNKKMKNLIHKYGAWHPLLNIMLAYPSGNVFKGSIDTIGK
jgi:hypothetical protein